MACWHKEAYISLPPTGQYFSKKIVFSRNSSDSYYDFTKVDISGSTTVDDAVSKLAAAINASMSAYFDVSVEGKKLTLKSKNMTAAGDSSSISGQSFRNSLPINRTAASDTRASFGRFSGGKDSTGIPNANDHDAPYVPATPATATVTGLNNAASGSGFTINIATGYGYTYQTYIRMAEGSSYSNSTASDGTYTIGKNSSFSNVYFGNARLSYANGTLTVTTAYTGAATNNSSFTDGIAAYNYDPGTYTEVDPAAMSVSKQATDIDPAKYILDVSSYKGNTDSGDMETFIQSLTGITDNYIYFSGNGYYEFIDTGSQEAVASVSKVHKNISAKMIDLNNMRNAVRSGQDIAEAFSRVVQSATAAPSSSYTYSSGLKKDTDGAIVGVYLANKNLSDPNQIFRDYDATLGHYQLDFSSVGTGNIAELDDKGFRFYCGTDEQQWYNFLFDDGKEDLPDRPASGTATLDINTATIDISRITDTASLVDSIYRDGDAMMAEINHYYRMSKVASDDSKLIIYDPRRFNISTEPAYYGRYRERGAKIADGVMDNVIKDRRDIMQKQIIIQDTDKADFNTRLYIDQTTLDHLFEYKIGNDDIFNYTVASQADREKFLGNAETGNQGMLDNAIQKLLEAQTLLGSQAGWLEATRLNLTVTSENEQASESVIRDVDMAKATVEFAKANILTQSSQAMLAQANNDTGSVLSLLQ